MKKAQAEIVGITIVMVLIMLGIVFVIRFVILPQDENIRAIYDRTQMASNFIDTFANTNTDCNELTMTELIQNCAENYDDTDFQYLCPNTAALCPDCRSCEFLNTSLGYILENSLNKINVRYDLFICKWDEVNVRCRNEYPEDVISYFYHKSCLNSTIGEYEMKQTPVPTDAGNRVIVMYICD
jgi:hypothetical protein